MTKQYAIIVAGGKGTRMQTALPKQFLELQGKPILMHTIDAFFDYNNAITIILVLPENEISVWEELCRKHNYQRKVVIQVGGQTRFQSVKNGLGCIVEEEGIVAVHDGVRPLIDPEIIRASFTIAQQHGAAVAAVALKESIRFVKNTHSEAVDRNLYKLIQTPQTFQVALLKQAYLQQELDSFTDDASVVEKLGHVITLFEGSYKNIKVTTPEDLTVAEALLKNKHNV
jgi:2-C-methyl-D-erythritol 4-phosphate cytidylyltransferase